jgi:hypothetical protein
MKAKAFAWLLAFEGVFYGPVTFRVLCWLAVTLSIVAIFFGGRWAFVSCAISLGVIAHTLIAVLMNVNNLVVSFDKIGSVYSKEVQSTEKKNPQEAYSTQVN